MTPRESDTQEFKRSFSQIDPSLKSVCGFLNHHGGVITFGRSDTGDPIGITPADHSLRKLSQQITSRIKPEISPDIRVIEESGVQLVTVTVPEGTNKPYFLDGIAYIRVGTENRIIPPDELKRIIRSSPESPWDNEFCIGATVDDIDPDIVETFLTLVRQERRIEIEPDISITTALEKLYLIKNGLITNAAILLFGTNPQQFFIQSEVRCGHFKGSDVTTPFISMKVIRGNLLNQIEESVKFILGEIRMSAWVPKNEIQRKEQWEYPLEAIRESVINALCHRDYQSSANTQIRIYSRKMEIYNPGELPSPLTIEVIKGDHISVPRNKLIAQMLFLSGFIEQWGSGINHIIRACRESSLPDPEFTESASVFSITFTRSSLIDILEDPSILNDRQKDILDYLKTSDHITLSEYANKYNCNQKTAQRDLGKLVSLNLVNKSGKTRATRYILSESMKDFPDNYGHES
jgi:ATP-dependent DNA helicase RecG